MSQIYLNTENMIIYDYGQIDYELILIPNQWGSFIGILIPKPMGVIHWYSDTQPMGVIHCYSDTQTNEGYSLVL